MPNNSMNFGVDLLPVTDTTYYLGSNEKRWKIFADEINGLNFNEVDPHFSLMGPTNGEASLPTWRRPNMMDLEPTIHKEYASTSQYGTNSDATCSFYMMSVRPDAWATPWRISFKIHSYCPAYPDRNSITWCTLTGRTDGVCYYNYNENINSGHYYIAAHILKSAGYNAGYGHAIGINIRYGNNYTDSAYYRTFELDYYDSENCTVTFLDNAVLWDNWEGASDTNYNGFANYDAINRGLRETGDDNETGRLFAHSNYLTNGSTLRLPPYSVFGFDRTWKTQSISLYSAGYSSSTTNINTARVYNTSGFDWKKGLLITNSGSNYAVNADVNISPAVHYYAADMRYNDNCVATSGAQNLGMQNRKPIFLRGVIKSDGLFYLAPITVTYNNKNYQRAWTQDIPTAVETDGTYQYVYWFLGFPYYNSSYANGLYQFNFLPWHPMYWYNDGKFEEYNPKITKADIGLGNVENTALSTWTGSNNITTVGTITTGTWNGTTIAVANGGTGATSASGARTNLGLGAAAVKGVTDNSSNADVTSSDTNLITGRTLYYQLAKKGYTTNTGTVTSVTLTSGTGITVSDSGTAITGSGSRTISITGMNTSSGSTSKCLTEKGTWASFSNNSGTVTSVTLTSGAGITVSDSGTAITGSGSRTISITGVDTSSGSTTQCLTKKGTWASFTNNAGTVTSVQVQASGPLSSSTSTAQSSTLSTTISFSNQDPNKVLAGPSSGSSAAAPTFRALVAADIPSLSWNKITSDKPTTLSGYGITDAVSSSALNDYVLKAGDTMTGTLNLKTSTIDITTTPSSALNEDYLYFKDKDGDGVGMLRVNQTTENIVSLQLSARRVVNTNTIFNGFELKIDSDGTRIVSIGAPDAWRTALGLGSMATASTGDYLALSGGTMTGTITLNNGVAMYTASEAGWSLNQYGNFTHRRTNSNDYLGVIGGSGDFRVYYDSGNVTTTGYVASNGVYATNGVLCTRGSTAWVQFQNASAQAIGEIWSQSGRIYIRERPSAGSSYITDIIFPAAKSNGNENVYVYTSRNFSLSGTTLTITVPS